MSIACLPACGRCTRAAADANIVSDTAAELCKPRVYILLAAIYTTRFSNCSGRHRNQLKAPVVTRSRWYCTYRRSHVVRTTGTSLSDQSDRNNISVHSSRSVFPIKSGCLFLASDAGYLLVRRLIDPRSRIRRGTSSAEREKDPDCLVVCDGYIVYRPCGLFPRNTIAFPECTLPKY